MSPAFFSWRRAAIATLLVANIAPVFAYAVVDSVDIVARSKAVDQSQDLNDAVEDEAVTPDVVQSVPEVTSSISLAASASASASAAPPPPPPALNDTLVLDNANATIANATAVDGKGKKGKGKGKGKGKKGKGDELKGKKDNKKKGKDAKANEAKDKKNKNKDNKDNKGKGKGKGNGNNQLADIITQLEAALTGGQAGNGNAVNLPVVARDTVTQSGPGLARKRKVRRSF